MRISDWSSDVCSSDLLAYPHERLALPPIELSSILLSRLAVSMHKDGYGAELPRTCCDRSIARRGLPGLECIRSEEHTSELQSLMRISYAVFCLKQRNQQPYCSSRSPRTNNNNRH